MGYLSPHLCCVSPANQAFYFDFVDVFWISLALNDFIIDRTNLALLI